MTIPPTTSWGVYLHTPWCKTRCPYCAFAVETTPPQWEAWVDAILAHFQQESAFFSGPAAHVYFGGGTPSLAPPSALAKVLAAIPRTHNAEVTVEANPGTIDKDRLLQLVDIGVNRLSVGIQTFSPEIARVLSRGHTVGQASALLATIATIDGFRSWSADLIFAVPGETLDHLNHDLQCLVDSGAPHVSVYGLSYEPGTPLTRARDAGRIVPATEDDWEQQYSRVVEVLENAGLERYEVSNFSLPGHRAQHNNHVWRGGHYMGLGPSAHGFRPDGTRTLCPPDVATYLSQPTVSIEQPDAHEAAIDVLLSTFRHKDGTPFQLLEERTGYTLQRAALREVEARKLLVWETDRVRLLPQGWNVADGLVRLLVEALAPTADLSFAP